MNMKVEFVRFDASDGVELQGWLSNAGGDLTVIHMHGMSGNGYEHPFLDNMHETYVKNGISFFSIDTRGHGIISYFRQKDGSDLWGEGTKLGGSCYEIFDESMHDIRGAIEYLATLGKTKFILQGHSLGGSKVVNYLKSTNDERVAGAILLAPTDMVAWANTEPKNADYIEKAQKSVTDGMPEALVGAQCWKDETPLSAQTYLSICKADTPVDIYRNEVLGVIDTPMTIIYGTDDIGITNVDGTIDKWIERFDDVKNANTNVEIIEGAQHSFSGYEKQLTEISTNFVKRYL